MCILRGSGYVSSFVPSGWGITSQNRDNPLSVKMFCRSVTSVSLTNIDDALRSFFSCFLVKFPLMPNSSRSIARSMSSLKRCMSFHTLLSEDPPLKTNLSAYGSENTICSTAVTHRSFSTALGSSIPRRKAVCSYTLAFCKSVSSRNFIVCFVYERPYPPWHERIIGDYIIFWRGREQFPDAPQPLF